MEQGIVFLVIAFGFLLLIRLFGAWMFRINDVIKTNKEILRELKEINLRGKFNKH